MSKDEAMSEASHAAAGAVSSGAAAAGTTSYEQQQQQPVPAASSGLAAVQQGHASGQQASSNGKADGPTAAGSGSSMRGQQQAGNSGRSSQGHQQIKIVINSTTVAQPAAVDAAAGGVELDSSSGAAGVKRSMPEVHDLSPGDDDLQIAKRVRTGEEGASPGEQGDNGIVLSELPEVAAAMNNPSQLQVRA